MKNKYFGLLLLCAISLLAYSNSFDTAFHFDDYHQLVKNVHLHTLSSIPRTFVDARMGSFNPDLRGYRPLTYTSFAISWAISGDNVLWHHIFNLALHVACAFLLYLLVETVLKKAGMEDPGGAALLACLLFASHPVQTGAVTYISGRAALLATFFYMLSFYSFVRYRESGPDGIGGRPWMFAAPVCYLAALLSKEMAISLLGVLLAYDLIFSPGGARVTSAARRWLYYAPFAVIAAVYLVVKKSLQGYVAIDERSHTVGEYLLSEAHALLIYLRVLVLPVNLNADYDLPATTSVDARVVLAAAIVVAALVVLYRIRKTDPAIAFFGLWFFITLSPESTIIPIEDIAVEYRLYLPLAGFITAAVLLVYKAGRVRFAGRAVAVAVLVLFVTLSVCRNSVWATEYTFWSDAAKKSPYSARVHANQGRALIDEGRYMDAINELNLSLQINPFFEQSYNVYNNLGTCYDKLGMTTDALNEFDRSTKVYPGYSDGYYNLGAMYYKLGRYAEARDALEKALTVQPDHVDARRLMSMLPDK